MNPTVRQRIEQNRRQHAPVLDLCEQSLVQIPEAIRELTHLQELRLERNAIQSLPAWLAELPQLSFIQLNQNPVREVGSVQHLVLDWGVWWRLRAAGQLDDAQVAGLWLRWEPGEMLETALALPNLRWLDLREQRLQELPPQVCELVNLHTLILTRNRLSALPSEIGQLQKLFRLELGYNRIRVSNQLLIWSEFSSVPLEITQLQNLATLNLGSNQLSSLPLEIAQLPTLASLDLSGNGLSSLPPEVAQLQNLALLDLRCNKLSSLPAEIAQLQNLASLDLSSNGLSSLPAEIAQLQHLASLDLSSNGLSSLPAEIVQLQHLASLDLSSNGLSSLPPEIAQLPSLASLNLGENRLGSLPPEIAQLQNLVSLDLNSNGLSSLPPEIAQLQNLTSLYLDNNELSGLPPEIAQLPNLAVLDLNHNHLSSLPPEITQLQNLASLELSSNELRSLPAEITQLQGLASLNLNSNGLSSLPPEIGQLQNLASLDLSYNQLRSLPSEIAQLQSLASLDLSYNQLRSLPTEMAQLQTLASLGLSHNHLGSLPAKIAQLQSLAALDLSSNGLRSLPAEIAQLQSLAALDLSMNHLSSLPAEITQLQSLASLDLSRNGLRSLPAEIAQLQSLASLDLSDNQLSSLPAEIAQLHDLRDLAVQGNPLTTPPVASLELKEEIIGNRHFEGAVDLTKLRVYFRDARQGTEPIYEAKLLIIGEGGAGKTTLAWRLMNPNGDMPNQDQSTEGIDVWQKDLDCLIDGKPQSLRLNIWDFGGQDIYHATHQFFLSHDALYALVADTRRDDTDFFWWLSIVEKLGGDSPVLLVKNERDERAVSIDEGSLFKRFHHNLKRILATNLATKRGLSTVEHEMSHHAQSLKHIGQHYPKLWKTVREKLEARPEPYISWDDYLNICRDTQLPDDSAAALMSLLHNLGVCLHFADVPLLAKTVILKPSWATEAVYRVLDDREVQLQTGHFTVDDVQRIWQTPKKVRECRFADCLQQHQWQPKDYAQMHHELLEMMKKFELCYELPNNTGYIAPSLLEKDSKQDQYDFPAGGLKIIYDYTGFMPKGLTGHLLVRRYQWIEDQRRRAWRYGAVLAHQHTRAEIIEDRDRREFSVRLVGDNCRDMATLLMDEMDTIQRRFKGLEYQISIPCQCQKSPQWMFDLEVLKNAAHQRQPLQCQQRGCFKMLDAELILRGVFTEQKLAQTTKYEFSQIENLTINELMPTSNSTLPPNNPWISGSFYLAMAVIILTALGIIAWNVPWWTLLPVMAGGLLFTVVIGAFQLQNDDNIQETNFMKLMAMTLKQLPLLEKLMTRPAQGGREKTKKP